MHIQHVLNLKMGGQCISFYFCAMETASEHKVRWEGAACWGWAGAACSLTEAKPRSRRHHHRSLDTGEVPQPLLRPVWSVLPTDVSTGPTQCHFPFHLGANNKNLDSGFHGSTVCPQPEEAKTRKCHLGPSLTPVHLGLGPETWGQAPGVSLGSPHPYTQKLGKTAGQAPG